MNSLLIKIEREKNKLHLATAMDGMYVIVDSQMASELLTEHSDLSRKVYMLVDERLPKNLHRQQSSQKEHSQMANDNTIFWRSLSSMNPYELAATVPKAIGEFTAWPGLTKFLDYQLQVQERYNNSCGERTCKGFLNSNVYQGWKNRKTRGPSLLHVSGSGTLCSDTHCCQSMTLTL